jgi:hypothetical protein
LARWLRGIRFLTIDNSSGVTIQPRQDAAPQQQAIADSAGQP